MRNGMQTCWASGRNDRQGGSRKARNWWLRSPNPSNANNERNVNTDGSLNNNNANNGNWAVPDRVTVSNRVSESRKQYIHTGGRHPDRANGKTRPATEAVKAGPPISDGRGQEKWKTDWSRR